MSAEIIANGQPARVALPCSLAEFLNRSGWKPTQVVVELNGEVVPKPKIPAVQLSAGDRLEVIVPVAGG